MLYRACRGIIFVTLLIFIFTFAGRDVRAPGDYSEAATRWRERAMRDEHGRTKN